MRLPKFSAVVFDMDGLTIDSESGYIAAWKLAALEFGVCLETGFLRSLSGLNADHVESALQRAIGVGFDMGRFRLSAAKFWREHVNRVGIPTMPGLRGLLELLDRENVPYALATNSESQNAEECLRLSGLEKRFSIMVASDQVSLGKPEPDVFLEAARRMGVSPGDCFALEDSAIGLLAASRAGMTPVLVNPRAFTEESNRLAELSFRSLCEVAESIGQSLSL